VSADFRVGPWLVEPSLNSISRNGTSVRLEPKVMEVLACLAEHAGETLSKENLLQTVWPETFVSDDALKHCISELRRVFEDDAREPRVIQTIAKRGYRLVAPVKPVNGIKVSSTLVRTARIHNAMGSSVRRWWVGAMVATIILLSVLLVAVKKIRSSASGVPRIHSLAVLPLQNLSADPTQEYFSDGMTDALITDLAQIGSVKVISRTSIMRYKKTDKALPEIARELDVDGIVEGTVQRSGDRVRITAQLIHGPSDKHLWANSYERDIHDVFAFERDLTLEIAQKIQAQLTTRKEAQARTVNAKALDAYLQGNFFLNRFTEEETRKAQQYFQEAIDTDHDFAPAYVGLALAHYGLFEGSSEDARIAKSAAERALELDPTLSDARMTLGKIKLDSWDWSGMEQEYKKAIELNPNNANAHQEFGELLDAMGRLDDGFKECQIAQELDPNQDHLSGALDDRREFDRSIEIKLIMLRNDPDNAVLHHNLYLSYEANGMYKDAVEHLERAVTLAGFPEVAVNLDKAFAISGYKGAMREYAKQLEHAHATKQIFLPVNLAGVYATLGDKDRAFYWLEQAYRHTRGSGIRLWQIKLYPALEPLHSDPRFKDLVHRIGLPP
jgi:TolB-like protein/DNA-binding winged helix-turn-helix (wHTH) protein